MKTTRHTRGRSRITRTISLFPAHEALLAAEVQARTAENGRSHGLHSVIVQELIEEGLGSKPSKRFAPVPSTFRADCYDVLQSAGWSVSPDKVIGDLKVDLWAAKAKRAVAVLLVERTREARLENALGTAMLVKSEAKAPVIVCVPYILDHAVAKAFEVAGSKLCDPGTLLETVGRLAG